MKRKRLSLGRVRDIERSDVRRFNDNRVSLPNPQSSPDFDRHSPISGDKKSLAFGMEPTRLKSAIDLPQGDAGAGNTVYRKIHAFYSMDPDESGRVGATNFTKALPIITTKSVRQKPSYWHISVYGVGVRRAGDGAAQIPLTDSEIRDRQFEEYFLESPAGTFVPLTPRFVPSVNVSQVRVMIHDESGQRFFDADVIGNRSFSLYGWGATVFLLVKEGGYEVDAQNPSSNMPLDGLSGFEDDLVGGRIVGIARNRTESVQNRTLSVAIDPEEYVGAPRIIPIPPGSRTVQIFSTAPGPLGVSWGLQFWYGRGSSATRVDLGNIDWVPGQSKTQVVGIPNAPSIAITPLGMPMAAGFSLVFEVEP